MNPFRIALAGCGDISNVWLSSLAKLDTARVVGLVDLDITRARTQAEAFALKDVSVGSDLENMILDTGAEVVFDCTVPPAHHGVVLTALAQGCHVFGEKPLAETMPQAREMVAAAEKAGRVYGVMQNRRWLPGIRRVRHALDAGCIGKAHSLHADFFLGPHFGGFREEMKHVLLLDMAIHSFDQARFLLDANPLSSVAAEWNPPGSWYGHGASAMAFFEMDGGRTVTYRGSWCAEGLPTSWECAWRIVGDKGTLIWDGGQEMRAEVVDGTEGFLRPTRSVDIPEYHLPEADNGHSGAIRNFLQSLAKGKSPATPASDNLHSLAMVHAAIRSAESGCRVDVSE